MTTQLSAEEQQNMLAVYKERTYNSDGGDVKIGEFYEGPIRIIGARKIKPIDEEKKRYNADGTSYTGDATMFFYVQRRKLIQGIYKWVGRHPWNVFDNEDSDLWDSVTEINANFKNDSDYNDQLPKEMRFIIGGEDDEDVSLQGAEVIYPGQGVIMRDENGNPRMVQEWNAKLGKMVDTKEVMTLKSEWVFASSKKNLTTVIRQRIRQRTRSGGFGSGTGSPSIEDDIQVQRMNQPSTNK